MIRGADLSHADICEISTELDAEENPDPQPPGHVHHHRRGRLRRQLSEAHRHPSPTVLSHQRDWPGRDVGAEQCRGAGTARLRDLRCVAAVARQARMLRSPKLQCESGRSRPGSSRSKLRTPASARHCTQPSTGRDNDALRPCAARRYRAKPAWLGAPCRRHTDRPTSGPFRRARPSAPTLSTIPEPLTAALRLDKPSPQRATSHDPDSSGRRLCCAAAPRDLNQPAPAHGTASTQ
jgi:hypothetical protein